MQTTIYNSYISSNFNYCQIGWMFTNKTNLKKLEKRNKRALRLVTNKVDLDYESICEQEKQFSIHKRCIKQVALQMYKIKRNIAPQYLQSLFTLRESKYDMQDTDNFLIPTFSAITYGKRSLKYYGAKLWRVPTKLRKLNSMTFPWLSMTKIAIFHDHFLGQDSRNFSRKIHFWKILETTLFVTKFWMQIRVKFVIFHDHFRDWDSCKFFTGTSSLDNFRNYHISD